MRPDVVWFGEPVNHCSLQEVQDLVREVKHNNGVFITVGTSGEVYPAANFISMFSQVKNKYIVDLQSKNIGDYKVYAGPAAEQLPLLVQELINDL